MIKPTVGRVVWYWPRATDLDGQPHAALIAYVHSDTMVNLAVFNSSGNANGQSSVLLWQGEGRRPAGESYCEWMPYQIGQAAKHEQPVTQS